MVLGVGFDLGNWQGEFALAVHGLHRLTALKAQKLKRPGRYADGGGLYLVIDQKLNRKWVLRVQTNGRRRDFGLGSCQHVPLAEAREGAKRIREQLRAGLDPVAEKKNARRTVPTFRDAAICVHKENLPTWRNEKHAAQWLNTLKVHAFPHFGDRPIDQIDGPMVREMLIGFWLERPETARRVRQRVGSVLDWAEANGFRQGPSPTRSLGKSLPRQPRQDTHFTALPWQDVPDFLRSLREESAASKTTKLLLEFTILTAARSGESRGAEWNEFDIRNANWEVPASRMKAGKVHTVPLSNRVIEILDQMSALRRSDTQRLVFEGIKPDRPTSDMTMTKAIRRMGVDVTVHGFRSSFRDWCAEATSTPREVAERALAHVIPNQTERAYNRSDLLERRRQLMVSWERHCLGRSADIVPIPSAKRI